MQRPANAWEVLSVLTSLREVSPESDEIRESFLQAAQFVGREAELNQLLDSYQHFLEAPQPTAWLVGGESGVGKSRLLDEFRVRALVSGAVVLRGQGISGGGHPYQLWLQIFRYLALSVAADSLEARVLKPFVPDIETFVGAAVRDAAVLDPAATRTRLITTMRDLLLHQGEKVVLILEDLQWASHESLELIRALTSLKLMIVGSYRDDETPQLPADFPMMQTIKLKRLSTDDIRALSMSILGDPGHNPEIVTLLQRETEGNVFFMVEAIRALAEEAGQLDRIGHITLPAHVFAGGIQNLIQRRLGHLSESTIEVLQAAAVIGRRIDLKLMAHLHPKLNLDQWLTECANAAVLEFFEEEWRFAHDKLREALLSLSEYRLKDLHRVVAQAITIVYGKERAAALAYHWGKAGDRAQEAYYSGLAGEMSLNTGANQEAVTYLAKALAFEPSAMRERQMGQALYGLGQLKQAREHLQNAVALLNERLPDQLILGLISQVGKQAFHRIGIVRRTQDRERTLEAARIYGLIGEICYFTAETILGIYGVLRMLNLSERTQASRELARACSNMCIAGALVGQAGIADYFSRRAEATARELADEIALMEVQNVRGVYLIGAGLWEQAQAALEESFRLAQTLGDRRQAIQSRTTLAVSCHYQGKFVESMELNQWAWDAAKQTGNAQQVGWGMYSKSENLFKLGQASEALALYLESYEVIHKDIQTSSEIRVMTGIAGCHLALDQVEQAESYLQKAWQLLGKSAPNVYSMLDSYAMFVDLYLTLAERGIKTDFERINAGYALFKGFTKLYPIGRPRMLILGGRLAALQGKKDLAAQKYTEAYTSAGILGMKYDQQWANELKSKG
jgi:tetratricopeptide (TPR) repeat protein